MTRGVLILNVVFGGDLPAARSAPTVPLGGINVMAEVLIARKSTMGFEATPGSGFSFASSDMAFRPKGVAALPRPSMLAAMFMIMAPMAG